MNLSQWREARYEKRGSEGRHRLGWYSFRPERIVGESGLLLDLGFDHCDVCGLSFDLGDVHMTAAVFVQWLLGELFCLAQDDSPEERALLRASIAQDLRVLRLERESQQ